jgi:hypothetical protein
MEAAQAESHTDLVRHGPSTPRRGHVDPHGRLSGDMRKYVLAQIVKSEKGKRKYPARPCRVCAVHKKGVKRRTFANSV